MIHTTIRYAAFILSLLFVISVLMIPIIFNQFITSFSTDLREYITVPPSLLACTTYVYCKILQATWFCDNAQNEGAIRPLSQVTRSVATSAKISSDIFDSVIGIGNPFNLALHQAEILELGLAIQYSSAFEGRELLAIQLWDLSEQTKEVKDRLIGLNSQGINTFSFIAHEFSRIQDLVEMVHTGSPRYSADTISHNLDLLYDHLSLDLSRLLLQVEHTLPIVARAGEQATSVTAELLQHHQQLLQKQESATLWRKLLDNEPWGNRQLKRDIVLTSESVQEIMQTWRHLEDLRSVLIAYRNNVVFFKASLVGFHIADHQLSVEDEVHAMRHIIQKFKQAVQESRPRGNPTVHTGIM